MNQKHAINIVKEEFIKNGYSIEFVNALVDALNGKESKSFSKINYFSERIRLNFAGQGKFGDIPVGTTDVKDADNILAEDPALKRNTESLVQKSDAVENEINKIEQEIGNPSNVINDVTPSPEEMKGANNAK